MSTNQPLSARIKEQFAARESRVKAAEEEKSRQVTVREQQIDRFETTCEALTTVWRPRIEEFAKQFGDKINLVPTIDRSQREAKIAFLTDLAHMTLTLRVMLSPDLEKLVLDYDLLIVPAYFDYERHARLEMPLNQIDQDAIGKWIDDRLVTCVKDYLTIQDNEYYLKRAMVRDPITGQRFSRTEAAATFEFEGKTQHFQSLDTLKEFKQRHAIAG